MPVASDILYFEKSSSRAENDAVNRAREAAVAALNNVAVYGALEADATHGAAWRQLRLSFEAALKEVLLRKNITTPMARYEVQHLGGRANSCDFPVRTFDAAGNLLLAFKFEFKFKSMPEFVQLYDHFGLMPVRLAEFWWDQGILDTICGLYPAPLKFAKPAEREEYLKGAQATLGKKDSPSFFKQFYDLDHDPTQRELYKKKQAQTNAGIQKYLKEYIGQFNVAKLAEKLKDQEEKIYMIWQPAKKVFQILEYTREEMTPTEVLRCDRGNTVVLRAGSSEMHCLLRWKNTIGICNPAWQISLKRAAPAKPVRVNRKKSPQPQAKSE